MKIFAVRGFDLTWNWSPMRNCACTCVCVCVCAFVKRSKVTHVQKTRSCPNLPTRWHRAPRGAHVLCVFHSCRGASTDSFHFPFSTLTFAQIKTWSGVKLRGKYTADPRTDGTTGPSGSIRRYRRFASGISRQQQLRLHMEAGLRNSSRVGVNGSDW